MVEYITFSRPTVWIVIRQTIKIRERAQVDVFFLFGSIVISWSSKKQNMSWQKVRVKKVFGHREFEKILVWLKKKLTLCFCINMSAVLMTRYPVFHGSAKHIEIKQYCIGEQVNGGAIDKQY